MGREDNSERHFFLERINFRSGITRYLCFVLAFLAWKGPKGAVGTCFLSTCWNKTDVSL